MSLFPLGHPFILHLLARYHAKFGHKDKSFVPVKKGEKMDYSSPSTFITLKLNDSIELHPHICEIRTDILVYENGWVIKHIKVNEMFNDLE